MQCQKVQMQSRIFLPSNETLSQTIPFIFTNSNPLEYSFKPLSHILPKTVMSAIAESNSDALLKFVQETFVMLDLNPEISHQVTAQYPRFGRKNNVESSPPSLLKILNENIKQLLISKKFNYVQCFGHQYKDYDLHLKHLNFGKTILQGNAHRLQKIASLIAQSERDQIEHRKNEEMPNIRKNNHFMEENTEVQWLKKFIFQYTVIMKYQGQYFQVLGRTLQEVFDMNINAKGFIDKKNKTFQKYKKKNFQKGNLNANLVIQRFQMLYCSHTNRTSGLFRRNIFFDSGLKTKPVFLQVKILTEKLMNSIIPKGLLKSAEQSGLLQILVKFFTNVRTIFETQKKSHTNYSYFDYILAKYCRLKPDYKQIKADVLNYVQKNQGDIESLFERLYACQSTYSEVYLVIKVLLRKVLDDRLFGQRNFRVFIKMMRDFVQMKRYENYKIQDFYAKMNIFEIPWLQINYNKKYQKQIIQRARKILGILICMIFNNLIVPIMQLNYYITQKHKQANKLFYYRKPIWVLISKLALKKFSEANLQPINQAQYFNMRKTGKDYPEGKLRLIPKKGTFRPIITFNRKKKIQGDSFYKATINQLLTDTQLVLRNLKHILGNQLGFCIFDNKQISKKYDQFIKKWRRQGQPKLVYFTLDIKKCYDSIDTNLLIKIIERTPYIEQLYLLVKYLRIYRNKKPISSPKLLPYYFNLKQRIRATSLASDLIPVREDQTPAINIFQARQKLINRSQVIKKLKQLCQGSIIRYKNYFWMQKLGIPQGLNVSGVLCSLYFAYIQTQDVQVKEGLLMRLTDDYLYLGPEEEAIKVLTNMLQCAKKNNFAFNSDKITKNFYHPLLQNMTDDEYIHWIGKRININTLQMFPVYDQGSEKLAYAMNVNINRRQFKGFLRNKLKSLLTNHFAAYFKPQIFKLPTLLQVIRFYCRISLSKFFPFLISLNKLKIEKQTLQIRLILQAAIHQFLIYACSLHSPVVGCSLKEYISTDFSLEVSKDEQIIIQQKQDNFNKILHYLYHKYLLTVLQQFIEFLKNKDSCQFMKKIKQIFIQKWKKLREQLGEWQARCGIHNTEIGSNNNSKNGEWKPNKTKNSKNKNNNNSKQKKGEIMSESSMKDENEVDKR